MLSVIEEVIADIRAGVETGTIAARFHNTIAAIILDTVTALAKETGIKTVVLSGGVFQNRYLLGRSEQLLCAKGLTVLRQRKVPVNDAGIALGQLAVAAAVEKRNGD